MVKENRQL